MLLACSAERRKREDEEPERIKRRGLEEMMKRISSRTGEETPSSRISGKPLDLTDATFTMFVMDNSMAVVDVWAPWCGAHGTLNPCSA